MGVCCIVFDIDGMLFEFFMNFLNIEKNNFVFNISCFLRVSCYFQHKKNIKNWCKKKIRGGGGGGVEFFFLQKHNSFLFHVLCYFQH